MAPEVFYHAASFFIFPPLVLELLKCHIHQGKKTKQNRTKGLEM